jgi:hypothetical protein
MGSTPEMLKYQGRWATVEITQRYLKGLRVRERQKIKALGNANALDRRASSFYISGP